MTAPPAAPDTQQWQQQQQMAQMATPGGVSVMQPHIPDAAGIRPQQQMPEVATSEGHGQQFHQTQGQGWEQDQRYGQNWDQSHGQQSHQRQSQNWEQDQRHGQNWEQAPRTSAASTPRKAVPPNVAFQISKSLSTILRHKAQQLGLAVRPDGFCIVDEVLNLNMMKSLHATQEALEQI